MAILRKIVGTIVLPAGAIVSVPLIVPLIYADDAKPGKLVKPSDLPIYDTPKEKSESDVHVQEQSFLEKGVSSIRKAFFTQLDSFDDTKEQAKNLFDKGKTYTQDAIHYVREENNVVPRAVLITVSGLGGLLAGARGGFIKKVFYSSTGIVMMSSICYPQQALQISQDAYKIGKYYSIITYNKLLEQGIEKNDKNSRPSPTPNASSTPKMDQIADQMIK